MRGDATNVMRGRTGNRWRRWRPGRPKDAQHGARRPNSRRGRGLTNLCHTPCLRAPSPHAENGTATRNGERADARPVTPLGSGNVGSTRDSPCSAHWPPGPGAAGGRCRRPIVKYHDRRLPVPARWEPGGQRGAAPAARSATLILVRRSRVADSRRGTRTVQFTVCLRPSSADRARSGLRAPAPPPRIGDRECRAHVP